MPSLLGRRIRFGKPASRSVADVENVTHRPISGRKTAGGIGARIRLGLNKSYDLISTICIEIRLYLGEFL